MKTKVRLAITAIVTLAFAAFFQIETSKAGIIPVGGCEYTGNPNNYCRVGDWLEVYNCVNNYVVMSCGIEVEIVPE